MSITATGSSSLFSNVNALSSLTSSSQALTAAQKKGFMATVDATPGATSAVAAAATNAATNPLAALTGFYTQTIAQNGSTDQATPSASVASENSSDLDGDSVTQQFMNYAKETPMQRMTDQVMKSMGLTSEDIAHMTPAEQTKVEAEIKEKVQEALKEKLGGVASTEPASTAATDLAAAV